MIGTLLGNRYEIIEKIGEGGMAEVYKAKCRLLNRFVAVKILKEEYSKDKEFVNKFKAEAASAGSISHNNIVNIYDVGSEGTLNYIVMEYVQGITLKELIIQNGRLDYNRAIDIAIQIAKAIECAHKNNIIHRDIKPQNILVTSEGNIKVTDFGIAKVSNSVTITNTNKVIGSAHYFSPEQAKGSFVDGRTDIYSLGVVIYEMVTGKVPFDAESPVSVALKHLQEPVIPPKHINGNLPDGLNNLILKAMEKDPISRYQNIKDMLLDLQQIKNNSDYKIDTFDSYSDHTKIMNPVTDCEIEEKEDENSVKKKNSKKPKLKSALILVPLGILIVIIFFFAGWYIMSKSSISSKTNENTVSETVTVPSVVGMTEYEAEKAIRDKGLEPVIGSREKSDKPAGIVIASNPSENTNVKSGSKVTIYISSGMMEIKVPDVKGTDVNVAISIIENSGFKVGEKTYEFSTTIPENSIISQTPEANSFLEKGSKIDLVISKGQEIIYTKVPDLFNLTLKDAENLLISNNLRLGNKTPIETTDKNLDGKIVNQNPAPNASNIKEQSQVDVSYYVYKEEKITVPNFINKTLSEAKTEAASLGLNLDVKGKDNDIVIEQNPAPNTKVSKGEKIKLNTKSIEQNQNINQPNQTSQNDQVNQ